MPFSKVAVNWAILCPGPSLSSVQSVTHDEGGLIAVNGAVLGTRWIPDYWAVLDPEVFATVNRRSNLQIVSNRTSIWTFHNFDHFATLPALHPQWGGWTEKERVAYKRFNVILFDADLEKQMPFGTYLPWREFTMFTAIALAIIQGARRIRIYGADLGGAGYFRDGFENQRTNHRAWRWERERAILDDIMHVCRNQEIEVTRERGD